MDTKVCSKCKVEKDISLFSKKSKSKDGLCPSCKDCEKKKQREYYFENSENIKANVNKYRVDNQEKVKQRKKEYFTKNFEAISEKKKTYREENSDKISLFKRKHYQDHKQEINKKNKEWQSKNPELVKQYKQKNYENKKDVYIKNALERYHTEEGKRLHNARVEKYSKTEKGKITNRIKRARRRHIADSTKCDFTSADWENCLEHFENVCAYCGSSECISQDHVIPVTKFGSFTVDNIIPACKSCNSSKGNKDLTNWYKTKPYYTDEKHDKILNYINSHQ